MKQLMFGYMRVPSDMSDEEVNRRQADMTAYAEVEGFTLATVFHELLDGRIDAFGEMIDAIRHAEARHVIVPSYRDLALTRALQNAMILNIEHVSAQVVSLDESA
ncbi:recombinase family protein [Streptomyces sp. NPDC050610]|uniref:recombinase family protein n=1 Tax=Streptomyces sp. NPDC050610 TaxID=3157097 RepID=UPI00341D85B5